MITHPKPFQSDYLKTKDNHQIFFRQYGNKTGEAILILHGGPGSKSKHKHIQGFDLKKYHVISFDQRGCGQSLPAGCISHNTTQDLIQDINALKKQLKIKKWFVSGGSWGSTLALLYAQSDPKHVKGLLLSSIWLARPEDMAWSFNQDNGVANLFPDLWEYRINFLKKFNCHPKNASKVLIKKMINNSNNIHLLKQITAGVNNWEGNQLTAQRDIVLKQADDMSQEDINSVKIFLHYDANNFFIDSNQILNNMDKIKNIPIIIVHGRYDVICPIQQAWDLKQKMSNVTFLVLPTSNHKFTAEGQIAKQQAFNLFLYKQLHP